MRLDADFVDPPLVVVSAHSRQILGQLYLDWSPQPGSVLSIENQTYQVLERHHHYHLQAGRYHLCKTTLYVQPVLQTYHERTSWQGHWVLGDSSCVYNAHSELIRCAINPDGPCQGCPHYQPVLKACGSREIR